MSRPASRSSMASSSAMGPPAPNLAGSTTTVPFTPRIPKVRDALRPKGELTGRELDRIAETLASVRKVNPSKIREELENSTEDAALDNSFHPAETSFQTRPLKSRVSSSTVTMSSAHRRPSYNQATAGSSAATETAGSSRPASKDDRRREREEQRYRSSSATGGADRKGKGREALSVQNDDGTNHRHIGDVGAPRTAATADEQRAKPDRRYASDLDDGDGDADADYTVKPLAVKTQQRLLADVPLPVQEAWVCEDLGYVLRGVAGEIIRYDDDYDPLDESHTIKGAKWQVDPSLDSSLLNVVQRLLPMATYYVAINAFVDSRHQKEWGMVNHALASGIRGVLHEYHLLTTSLEALYLTSPTFTLQKAFYHLHPTSNTLSMLYGLCVALEYEDESDSDDSDDEMDLNLGLQSLGIPGLLPMGFNGDTRTNRGNIMGGEVLGVVTERAACTSGNPTSALLYSTLLLHSSQPYARMLLRWISTGNLLDPFSEFMVKENPRLNKAGLAHDFNDEYWERRYTLRDGSSAAQQQKGMLSVPGFASNGPQFRPGTTRFAGGACMPPFLEPWKHKILLAGKYLNVIRECGLEVVSWEEEADGSETPTERQAEKPEELIKMNDAKFYRRIDGAYLHANRKLLHLMLDDQELLPYLRSMKHFFFMDQSEFLNQFMENAASELRKPTASASVSKLQSLMYLAVSNPASSSSQDPRKEDLKITMKADSVYEYLKKIVTRQAGDLGSLGLGEKKDEKKKAEQIAVEALCFDIDVKFPLSLIISRKSIDRYQIVFRFLFSMHYLQFQLGNMWAEHKSPLWRQKIRNAPDMEKWKRKIFDLRAQMMQWVQHVLNYVTSDVLEKSWRKLEAKLTKVQTVDQLLADHTEYLEVCTKGCMLTSERLLTIVTKLNNTINSFSGHQAQFTRTLQKYMADRQAESVESKIQARWKILQTYESHWMHHIGTHFDAMKYEAGSEDTSIFSLTTRMTELRKASVLNTERA